MLVVMLALLLLFGPKDAPRILRKVLDLLRQVQQSANRFKNDLLSASLDPDVQARARDTAVRGSPVIVARSAVASAARASSPVSS